VQHVPLIRFCVRLNYLLQGHQMAKKTAPKKTAAKAKPAKAKGKR